LLTHTALRKQAEQEHDSTLLTAASNGTDDNANTSATSETDSVATAGTTSANADNNGTASTATADATASDAAEFEQTPLVRHTDTIILA
jgi:hypothetical protein